MSITLIHEELYEGEETDSLNFSEYLERLVDNLFQTYRSGNTSISLNMDLEENIFFNMDIAVPLGIVVNELISNSFKHAFPDPDKGTIQIKLFKEENACRTDKELKSKANINENKNFTLILSDNGVGIPETFKLEHSDTLGIQLVTTLLEQLDASLELKRDSGTEFVIKFSIPDRK